LSLPGHGNLTTGAITFGDSFTLAANKNLTAGSTSTIFDRWT